MRDKELIAAFGNGPRSNWREQILLPNFPPPVRAKMVDSRLPAVNRRSPFADPESAVYMYVHLFVGSRYRGCLTGGRHARWIHFSAKIDSRSSGPSGRHGTSMKFLQFGYRFETEFLSLLQQVSSKFIPAI